MNTPLAATAPARKIAKDTLSVALDLAEESLGEGAVESYLLRRYDFTSPSDAVMDTPELRRVADLAHEGHDQFRPNTCDREVCREFAHLLGTR